MYKIKKSLKVFYVFIIFELLLLVGITPTKVLASNNGKLQFSIVTTNNEEKLTLEEFSGKLVFFPPTSKYQIDLDLYVSSLSGNEEKVTAMNFGVTTSEYLKLETVTSGKADQYEGFPGYGEVDLFDYGSSNTSEGNISAFLTESYKNARNQIGYLKITSEPIKIATLKFSYISTEGLDGFEISANFKGILEEDISYNIDGIDHNYPKGEIDFVPLVVGNPNSGPNSNLSSLEITGASNKKYETSIGEVLETQPKPIELTYQDSLKELNIKTTQEKASATQEIKLKRGEEILPHSSELLPYQTKDELIITVTDENLTSTYIREITVTPASKSTDYSITTNRSSDIEKDSNGNYTVTVPFSMTDITITVIPENNATVVGDATIPLTNLQTGDTEVTITIKAEDGTTEKPYTITVKRQEGNSSKKINLTVNGLPSSNNEFSISEDTELFTLVANPIETTTTLEYSFDNNNFNKTISSTSISKGQTQTVYIKITSEDGTSETITVKIKRDASSNIDLKQIDIKETGYDAVTLTYNSPKNRYEYTLKSNSSLNSNITTYDQEGQTITLLDKDSKGIDKTIINSSLSYGENQFYIRVSAQNGKDSEDYSLVIIKQSDLKEITGLEIQNSTGFTTIINDLSLFTRSGNDYSYTLKYKDASNIRLIVKSSERSVITNSQNNELLRDHVFSGTESLRLSVPVKVKAENGTVAYYNIIINREAADTDNFLTDLKVNGITVTGFSETNFDNYPTVALGRTQNSVNLEAIKKSDKSTVEYYIGTEKQASSQISLTPGVLKRVEVRVTSESGAIQSYYINIISGSDANEITNIQLSGIPGSLFAFDKAITEYNISVPYTTNVTTVTATASEYAKITGLATYQLEQGKTISFVVYATSETGKESDVKYTFNITRKAPNTFKDLEALEIEVAGVTTILDLTKQAQGYKIRIDNNISSILLKASIKGDHGETIVGKTSNNFQETIAISEGLAGTVITVTVMAEDKTTKEYRITAIRANDNNEIDSVTINGNVHLITSFDSNNTLTLNDVPYTTDKLSFVASLADSSAKLTYNPNLISGNWVLSEGQNEITFFATSEYGTKGKEYKVVVTRNQANTANNLSGLEAYIIFENGNVGEDNLLEDIDLTNKNFKVRVDRNINKILVITKVLTSDRSKVRDMGEGKIDGLYMVYTKEYSLSSAGNTITLPYVVEAEKANTTNTYNLEVIRKNAEIEITNITIKAGSTTLYDDGFSEITLDDIAYQQEKINITITKKDPYSKVYINGVLQASTQVITYELTLQTGTNQVPIKAETEVLREELEADYKEETINLTYTKKAPSTVAKLDVLEVIIDGKNILEDIFNSDKNIYGELKDLRVDRNVSQLEIIASALENGKVTGTGKPVFTSFGLNQYKITVTAEAGNQAEYLVNIYRNNNDNTVSNILIDDESIASFDPETITYDLGTVAYTKENLNIELITNDEFAKTTGTGLKTLKYGLNTFKVYATSDFGTKGADYTITITREEPVTDINLSELLVTNQDGKELTFKEGVYTKGVYTYTIELALTEEISMVNIGATLLYPDKQNLVATHNFKNILITKNANGTINQRITFQVTAENNAKQDYEIIIIKGVVLSSDTSISDIKLLDTDNVNHLTYTSGETNYEVSLDYAIEQLKLEVMTQGKVTFINNLPTRIPVGETKVSFHITAENGTIGDEVYEIIITRKEASKDNTLKEILITGNGNTILGLSSDAAYTFDPETNIYNITLDESYKNITIQRTRNHTKQTLSGTANSTQILNHGKNTFNFTVGPEDKDGFERTYQVNITIKNSQIELTSLSVENLNFNEPFSKDTYAYTLSNLDSKTPEITILGTISDAYGQIDGIGRKILKEGLNSFDVTIRSEDLKTTKTYTISVTVIYSDDHSITDVSLTDQNNNDYITFDPLIETYAIEVPFDTTKLDLNITSSHPYATIIGAQSYLINKKETVITFKVIAENQEESLLYTINVTRHEPSTDASLSNLEVITDQGEMILGELGTQLIFNKDTLRYELKVSRNIKTIKVNYLTNNDKTTLLSNSSHNFDNTINLIPGINQISLILQAEDLKTTKRYDVIITQINSEVEITNIEITGHPINFTKEQVTYDLGKISADTQFLNLDVTTSDAYATLTGSGIQITVTGKNSIVVKAVSEDKTQSVTYTITYEKESQTGGGNAPKSSDANLYGLEINGLKKEVVFNFDPSTYEYTINLSYEDAQFFIQADTHRLATVRNTGLHAISEGQAKELIIQVTAEDGTLGESYKLTFIREKANTENQLEALIYVLGTEEQNLDVTKQSHTISTTPEMMQIELKATLPKNATATGLGVTTLSSEETMIIITVTAQNGDLKNYIIKVVKISNDANLSSLVIKDVKTGNDLTLNIPFDPEKTNYLISLDSTEVTEIEIIAIANSSLSNITGAGTHNLKSGTGQTTDRFNVIVTAQDKTQKIYTITIERQIAPEHSIIIDDLSLVGDSITYLGNDRHPNAHTKFVASQKDYTITVPYTLNNIFLSVTNTEGAEIFGVGNYALTSKETEIIFSITSKSGQIKSGDYTIKVIKEDPSTDNLLKDISINGKTIEGFAPDIFNYEFTVDVTKVTNLNLQATLSDLKSNLKGSLGEVNVVPGVNSYIIYVTAQDQSISTYEIRINSLSYDNTLTSLSVSNQTMSPVFNPNTLLYEVNVDYKTTLARILATSHAKAKIIGDGLKENLEVGNNLFTVYAVAENGIEGTKYQINIIREEPNKDATLKDLIITDKDGNILAFEGEFDSQKFNYIINIPKDKELMSVFITAEANNALATVFNTGNQLLEGLIDGGYHTILKVTVIAEDPNIRNVYTISIYRDVNLDNSIEIQEVNLIASDGKNYLSDHEFDQNITNYQVTVPFNITQMTLNVKTVGQVVGAGIKQFGSNHQIIYTFYTESQSGSNRSKTYTITVIKEEAKTDNILTNLSIDGIQVPNFDPNTNTYRLARPKQSNSQIQIDATANSFSTIQGTGVKTLTLGKNTFVISVIAQNGDINTYTIEIDYVDSNAFLENLIVKGTNKDIYNEEDAIDYTSYTFDPETYEYNVVVDSNTKNVRITGAAMDHQNARVTGFGTYPIGINPEKIRIFVTSADNVLTLTYTLNITRYAIPSNNAQLNTLSIENNTISFDKSRYVYEITVSNKIDSLKISAETFNPNGTVVIEGYQEGSSSNELSLSINNLQAGKNVILIKVTAEDGITQNYYRVIVNKEPKTDMLLTVLLILSLLLWIITVLILLINKNRQKNQSTDELIY